MARSVMRALEDEKKATGKSLSKIVFQAIEEHIDKNRVFVQARLTEYEEQPEPLSPERKARLERAMRLSLP